MAISQAQSNLRKIGSEYLAGTINSAEWAIQSGQEIKNLHRALAILANGGKSQMTAARWGSLGGRLQREFAYFNRFAAQVDNIDRSLLGEKFLNRAASYARAGRSTYWAAARLREAMASETMLERNVLGASAQSCGDCIAETELGAVPVGTLSEPGSRQCGSGCNCDIIFEVSAQSLGAESEEAA